MGIALLVCDIPSGITAQRFTECKHEIPGQITGDVIIGISREYSSRSARSLYSIVLKL